MLPDCLTDGSDVVSDLEQEEMKILREVLRYPSLIIFFFNESLEFCNMTCIYVFRPQNIIN